MISNDQKASKFRPVRQIRPGDLRRAAMDVLGMARMVLGATNDKWEAPEGDRKNWRRRLPDGSYEYRPDRPDDKTPKQQEDGSTVKQDGKPEQKDEKKEEPVKYKNYLRLNKPKLQETLTKGHFSIISAGRNGSDPKEALMKWDDPFFHKRHEELRKELEKAGLVYTECMGHYGSPEDSFLVFHDDTQLTPKTQKSIMVHHRDADEAKAHQKIIEELGKRFNQNSVLHGSAGRNDIVFTTGQYTGKSCGGNGWKESQDAKDDYTDIDLEGKDHTKFQMDIHECFERKMLSTT